jgi:hypothetical protein
LILWMLRINFPLSYFPMNIWFPVYS